MAGVDEDIPSSSSIPRQDITLDIDEVTHPPRSPSLHSSEDDRERDELCGASPSSPTGFCGGRGEQNDCCKTILAFVFLFYNMTLNLFILSIVHERVPTHIKQPLPDISFDVFPRADWALNIAEYIIVAQVSLVFVLFFIHRYRYVLSFSSSMAHDGLLQCHHIQEVLHHFGCSLFIQSHLYAIDYTSKGESKLLLFSAGEFSIYINNFTGV